MLSKHVERLLGLRASSKCCIFEIRWCIGFSHFLNCFVGLTHFKTAMADHKHIFSAIVDTGCTHLYTNTFSDVDPLSIRKLNPPMKLDGITGGVQVAGPFKSYSVVIPCPRSPSPSRFQTHCVILCNHYNPWCAYGKASQRSNEKGPSGSVVCFRNQPNHIVP